MPSQSRRQYATVEVKPNASSSKANNLAPSSPGSPKVVRFATLEKAQPRSLTDTEKWSLWHFENHAYECPDCRDSLAEHRQSLRLCGTGHSLAQDVTQHVYRRDGVVYSAKKDNHKLVRVEIPRDYYHVAQLLKVVDRASRSASRPVPIVSPVITYDRTYAVRRPVTQPDTDDYLDSRREVILEPATSLPSRHHKSKHQSKYPSKRYAPVVEVNVYDADVDVEVKAPSPAREERRGSLYYDDMQRQRKEAYRVEIREPDRSREGRRRERPKSGFWS